MLDMPHVDWLKCNGCGICVSVCQCGAFVLSHGKVVIVETQECGWCTLCEAACPRGAVSCPYEISLEE